MNRISVPELCCVIRIDFFDEKGNTKRVAFEKGGRLKIVRGEDRDLLIKASDDSNSSKNFTMSMDSKINSVQIHSKFVNEGKASVVFTRGHNRTQLMLSNCPPSELKLFLNALGLKAVIQNNNEQISKTNLSNKFVAVKRPVAADKISPLSINDVKRARVALGNKSSYFNSSPKISKQIPTKDKKTLFKDIANCLKSSNLTRDQAVVAEAVLMSKVNVFFTGSAGTGKSYLLRYITSRLPPESTVVSASTGIAASHINGITLHTFAGIGPGTATVADCVASLVANDRKLTAWRKVRTLIIDEVSMIDGLFFDKLEEIARTVRGSEEPFGGIQLVLCGDFLQLPPVRKRGETKLHCFQAKSWDSCVRRSINLRTVMRQKESSFVKLLEKVRKGVCDKEVIDALVSTSRHLVDGGDIIATRLCTHKNDVEAINKKQLEALDQEPKKFRAYDSQPNSNILDTHCPSPREFVLKVGAQVILNKNLDTSRGLVNGARGVVTKFERRPDDRTSPATFPMVKFVSGLEVLIKPENWLVRHNGLSYSRTQLPLNLAWSLSIHKSQGMSLDCVEISLGRVFECGQAYVALSRAKAFEGLRIVDFSPDCIRADAEVLQFYKTLL